MNRAERREAVRRLMSDYVPRTSTEVARLLDMHPADASCACSELGRDSAYLFKSDKEPGGFAKGRAHIIWQRRMHRTLSEERASA